LILVQLVMIFVCFELENMDTKNRFDSEADCLQGNDNTRTRTSSSQQVILVHLLLGNAFGAFGAVCASLVATSASLDSKEFNQRVPKHLVHLVHLVRVV
jgi:hypothetical protein